MSVIQRKYLCELSTESKNVAVVVLIIGKSEPKFFKLNRNLIDSNAEEKRGILTFTIRDSKRYFTNCKFWGTQEKIKKYNKIFHIGDVIVIISPKILPILNNELQFQPLASTPFYITVNEGSGNIDHQYGDSNDIEELKKLLKYPIKPLNGALNLANICYNSQQNHEQLVELLVCVKFLKPIRSVQIKSGELRECLEVVVIDKSSINGISLTIWNTEWIRRAQNNWKPFTTILHLIDIRVNYSEFYKSTVLGLSGRTIITENPIGKEVDALLLFVSSLSFTETSFFDEEITRNLPNPDSITTVMTVRRIYDYIESHLGDENIEFTSVLYAMITKFDIDGSARVISRKCIHCKRFIKSIQNYCENEQCQMNMSIEHSRRRFEYFFNINVHLTDHTGTLVECSLNNQFAQNFLEISAIDFVELEDWRKISMKWKYLMERFQIKLFVKKKPTKNLTVILLDIKNVDLNYVAEKILV